MSRRNLLIVGLALALFAALPAVAPYVRTVYAAPGDLDPTFGSGGKVTTAFPLNATSEAQAVSFQPDGKIVLAGYSESHSASPDFGVMRYNVDGTLDTSFSGDGSVTIDFRNNEDRANAIAVQSDGKIVTAGFGSTDCCDAYQDFALARFNPDGTLDTGFGNGGKVLTNVADTGDNVYAVALQPDGKIVVAGVAQGRFALARYNSNGTLDTSFATVGYLMTSFSGTSFSSANDLAIQSDGKIVAAGTAGGSGSTDFALARYNSNGTLDTSFGTSGKVLTNLGTTDAYQSVAVQSDGKIAAAGYSISTSGAPSDFAVARYNSNGTLDTGFGTGGTVLTDFNATADQANSLVLTTASKIAVAGYSLDDNGNRSFALARYNSDGTPDAGFGNGGKVITAFLNNWAGAYALAADGAGKLVAAGQTRVSTSNIPRSAAATARYNLDGSLDATFSGDGKATDYWISSYGAINDVAIQSDGKIVSAGYADAGAGNGARFMLARHNPNGSLDTGFGNAGIVTTPFTGTSSAGALTIQPDSKIIAVGRATSAQEADDGLALARYNPNGSLDTGFGNGGMVVTHFSSGTTEGKGVVVQPDGKIVATGYTAAYNHTVVARYNSNGTLDTGFGNGGTVIITNQSERNNDLALQPDGKILVVGTTGDGTSFLVARYNPNGTPDLSFGSGGRVTTDLNGYDEAHAVALMSDGKIVVGGQTGGFPPGDFALVRYYANGALDQSFGNAGIVVTDFGGEHEAIKDLAIQADGKLVAGGEYPFKLARYNSNGGLDPTFGVGGKITTNFGQMSALALQADGKIVAAGLAFVESDMLGALARYQNDAVLTPTPTVTGTPPVASPSPTPCTPGWNLVPAVDPGGQGGALSDVLAFTPNDIWTVGTYYAGVAAGGDKTFVQRWNGAQWQIIASPNITGQHNSLLGIGAVSTNDIWAVGNAGNQTLTMRWTGQSWSIVPSPNIGSGANVLGGVAAIAANDAWAVGSYAQSGYRKLLLHWDGTSWNNVPGPDPNTYSKLNSVSALSTGDIWAAGLYNSATTTEALLMHWNGQTWSITPGPSIGSYHEINDIIAISANDVWAVGFYYSGSAKKTLTLHWNGTQWSNIPSPAGVEAERDLLGVEASGPNEVWAAGERRLNAASVSQNLVLRWDGSAWSESTSLNGPRGSSALAELVALAPNNVWVVGRSYDTQYSLPLIEQYRGSCSAATPTSVPSANPTSTLTATSTSASTTASPSPSATRTAASQPSQSATRTATVPYTATATRTATRTATLTATRSATATRTIQPTSTATACSLQFADVPPTNTFYPFVRCLACRGIDRGFPCGGPNEPCTPGNANYFRVNSLIARDDLAHMVAASAGFNEDPGARKFQDVPPSNPYYAWVQRMAGRGLIGGYQCGTQPSEPCVAPGNLPYYRPTANATRGQIAKIVSNGAAYNNTPSGQTFEDVPPSQAFYVWVQRLTSQPVPAMGGYPCGGVGEPCVAPNNRPYFRWGNNATRGQVAKITANTFFPSCQP